MIGPSRRSESTAPDSGEHARGTGSSEDHERADILVLAPRRAAKRLRAALEDAGVRLRYARPPSRGRALELDPDDRPDLVLFTRPATADGLGSRVAELRDLWPGIPVMVAGDGYDPALADALSAGDVCFVTQAALDRLVAAVDRGVRASRERALRQEAEETVRRQRSELKTLVDTAPDLIAQFDEELRYTYVNEALLRLTGLEAGDVLGKTRSQLDFPPVDAEEWEAALEAVFESGEERRLDFPYRAGNPADLAFEARIAPETTESGRVRRVVMVGRDVTEQRLREERVEYMSRHDALTDLPNRRVLRERLEEAVHRARRGRPSTLLFLDVDNFKLVNDEIGHEAGDEFLVEFGAWLRDTVRPTDLVVRAGGDEFAVLLEDAGQELGSEIADRLRSRSTEFHFSEGGFVFRPTLTVGAVVIDREPSDEWTEDEYLRRAEVAMRRGKEAGKARVVFYRPGWGAARQMPGASHWLSRLRAALDEDRLEVYLQPILDLDDGRPPTFEALVRLQENGEVLSPERFLTDAERFGLVAEIDQWMIGAVLRLLEGRADDLRIAVNVSGKSVGIDRLARHLSGEARVRPNGLRGLVLEVTETAALHHFGDALRWMQAVGELDVPFVLDDFGTGFASFSYLQRLPVEAVKIDGRLVEDLPSDPSRQAIVRSIVDVCHALERRVVAEAVEDEVVLEMLRAMGVDAVQGFHIGPPCPASEVLG